MHHKELARWRRKARTGPDVGLTHTFTQLIVEQTEQLLEKWKHPDPYRPPTAPGGSKYERNLPVPQTDRMCHHESGRMRVEILICLQHRHQCTCRRTAESGCGYGVQECIYHAANSINGLLPTGLMTTGSRAEVQ